MDELEVRPEELGDAMEEVGQLLGVMTVQAVRDITFILDNLPPDIRAMMAALARLDESDPPAVN